MELFFTNDAGLTAEEVALQLPDLDQATVYRALNQLEEVGIVEHLHLGHGAATYRRAGATTVPAICEGCGAVVQVPVAELEPVTSRLREAYGFHAEARHFALTGRCARCAAEVTEPAR